MTNSAQESDARKRPRVAIVQLEVACYPDEAPFHPSVLYPEYPFGDAVGARKNFVYDGVRRLFQQLGYDAEHFGTPEWNPLGGLIRPGMKVVLKPNWVLSRHHEGGDLFSIITHPSVLRAVGDYVWIALKGSGELIFADAPQYNCNFDELLEATHMPRVMDFYSRHTGAKVEIRNLQPYWSNGLHMPSEMRNLSGDPEGSVRCNLGEKSAFVDCPNPERYYGAVYWRNETIAHHTGHRQEYLVARTILSADVVISVPKLKVHKKVGVTMNLKGLVGTCTNKNLVVHYRLGTPQDGGDQFPDNVLSAKEKCIIKFERWMYDTFLAKKSVFWEMIHRFIYGFLYLRLVRPLGVRIRPEIRLLDAGNWYGNDSAWRMVVDLARIIHFCDAEGRLHSTPQRRLFSIVDGIIGGENKGPLVPDRKAAGVLIGGENFVAVDMIGTRIMGFDWRKIKQFTQLANYGVDVGVSSLRDIEVLSDSPRFANSVSDSRDRMLDFKPYPGWVGHIEI